jgi:hypothetical protein
MKKYLIVSIIFIIIGCKSQKEKTTPVYKSDAYTLFRDKIKQGTHEAFVISSNEIKSNYKNSEKSWKKSLDLSNKPKYTSDQPIVDALFNLSTEEAIKNIEADSTLRTGAKWGGVWTRDISYSIFLAFAYQEPEIGKISLMKKVNRDRIIQDTGSGGAWPISSDRVIWASGAWEIYKVTGDNNWLKKVFPIIKNSLEDDYKTIYDAETGLFKGESSFLDWREQTYPKWMSNMDIFVSENLGTNVAHYKAYKILAEMAQILKEPTDIYEKRATDLKTAINAKFWMKDKGFYGQYLYGRPNLTISPRFEALGESLAVLFEVADNEKSNSIFQNSPITAFGVTCIYPQIPEIPPYHNNAIWPFVQAYWNLAAAKTGNEKALLHGLSSIYRAGGLFLTNYENMVAETGDFEGTEINSDRMLWSMAGNLAMVNRVFIGLNFEKDGLRFLPTIPKAFGGKKSLTNFKYRAAILDIEVNGFGQHIKSIKLNGKELPNAFFPANLKGKHSIVIKMDNQSFDKDAINLVPNHFSLPNPIVSLIENSLQWKPVEGAKEFFIYKNGSLLTKTNLTNFVVDLNQFATYKVSAIDDKGWESFTNEPIMVYPKQNITVIETENNLEKSILNYTNYTGSGFIESTTTKNREIEIDLNIEKPGKYLIDFRYSNGSGPWNTENKCAIRSLYLNNNYVGTLVFPQRGTGLWSDWDYSNSYQLDLKKGSHKIKLVFENWNNNMNVETNTMMLDNLRIIYLE